DNKGVVSVAAGFLLHDQRRGHQRAIILQHEEGGDIFEQEPQPLDVAFRSSCDSPGDELRQISRSVLQCRIPPPPDVAAFLVLQYDGALVAPTLVVQKETGRDTDNAFVVELSYFAEVIQKSGNARRIYFKQRSLDGLMDELLAATGGRAANR
ncbi:MAG: hypothetical protein AAFY49_11970, partial [Pseudomonadota bacterium]